MFTPNIQLSASAAPVETAKIMPKTIPLRTILQSFPDFETAKFPLRPSSLKKIANCNVSAIMEAIGEIIDEGNAGANTGSVTHEAVAAFHKEQQKALKEQAGIAAIAASLPKFPLADRRSAEIYFEHYAKDPRNINAVLATRTVPVGSLRQLEVALELPVKLVLPPHSMDETKEPIHITGTLDQIRNDNGTLNVYDYKTGETSGFAMINDYAYQLAAYMLAAKYSGWDVTGAKLIRGYTYRERARAAELPSPPYVFLDMGLTLKTAEILMDRLRREVMLIRRGIIDFGTGPHCGYCKMKSHANCIPIAGNIFGFDWR